MKLSNIISRLTLVAGLCLLIGASATAQIRLTQVGTFRTGIYDNGGAEISAFDPASNRLFFIEAQNGRLVVLNIANPANPVAESFSPIVLPNGFKPNSVAARNGVIAVAAEDSVKTNPGRVYFYNASGSLLGFVPVGALPDMLTFNGDGTRVITANEGEPNNYNAGNIDPEGSVSIITLNVSNYSNSTVQTVGFTAFNVGQPRNAELPAGVRIFGPNATVAQDLEPEHIAVAGDTAFVVFQENNALGLIRISTASVIAIKALGFKDHNAVGNGLDASDRDVDGTSGAGGRINIQNWPVRGLYQPDGIAAFVVNNQKFVISANEGDARDYPGFDEETSVGNAAYLLDTVAFPTATSLKLAQNLGRLTVTRAIGDTTPTGRRTAIYAYGARSFSIWNDTARLIYDSGDQFERITAQRFPANFNASNSNNTLDNRSDNKGPEPEGVALGRVGDSLYAFIGLERIGGVMTYNITNPNAPYFVDYVNSRNFSITPGSGTVNTVGDLGVEGVLWIPASQSPSGKALIVTANEVSGTVTFFEVAGIAASVSQNIPAAGLYSFNNATNTTGLSINFGQSVSSVSVSRFTEAPLSPSGIIGNVSQYRWTIFSSASIGAITARIKTGQIPGAGISNPANVIIYSRTSPTGAFVARTTTVSGDTLVASIPVLSASEGGSFLELALGSTLEQLPVELTAFTVKAGQNRAELAWTTATETNNDRFEVERSSDNLNFVKIGFVNGKGTTTEAQSYRFVDENVTGRVYYRLKQIDFDGAFAYLPVVETIVGAPASYALSQNYPNPFNPTTMISYQLPTASQVVLKVYDVVGREVATLVNGKQNAGKYDVNFNAAQFASGVYFYRLQAGSFVETKKMLLVK